MTTYGDRLKEAVARQLKAERAAAGMTQIQVAEKVGQDKQTVMRNEAGKRDISIAELGQLADVFGITPQELLRRAEERIQKSGGTDS
ncbi:MAG: helix-turn-helix transcriptional regulator [Micrococcus sp.]|nr:helix-turn-helix transcriptional regulator [Micrococcus sp.]